VAEELAGRGVPIRHALAVVNQLTMSAEVERASAREFQRLFGGGATQA
jgi:hypothetical protein